ncbi:MAG: hypothetical protein BWY06_00212 [Candidatus Latescibacteria bacterium ADurb.Bin168]|nr:MAG: hypothetical protein BWY06_00212 [Candidatus Latescibacteria bacterium ADurb.Bin168]
MKIVHAGIFRDHELGGDIVLRKGLVQNGCSVDPFDFRSVAAEHGTRKMHDLAWERISSTTDVFFIGKGNLFKPAFLHALRERGVVTVLWYGDMRPDPEGWLLDLLPEVDFLFMTSGGSKLEEYYRRGKPSVASFFLNPSDPDLPEKYATLPRGSRDVVFTGSAYSFIGDERKETVRYLQSRNDVSFFGGGECACRSIGQRLAQSFRGLAGKGPVGQSSWIRGADYIAAIRSAKIGVGVSGFQNIPRYTSDRLTHYLEFGSFYLPWAFPGLESLFDVGKEIIPFVGTEDLDRKIAHYLRNVEEREGIAAAGQRRILSEYNAKNIVGMMLDVVATGSSKRFPWVEIYK